MVRQIPSLRVLSLRSVGSHACNAETTFAKDKETGEPSSASRLLRSFHDRENGDSSLPLLSRRACVGPGSTRRANANDVDLNHPFVACLDDDKKLVMMYGNPALDCLQSYLDSLVELGRMDDTRLGVNFFKEWKINVMQDSKKRKRTTPLGALGLQNWTIYDRTIRAMLKSGMGEYLGVLDLTGVQGLTDDLLHDLLPQCPNLERLSLKNCRRITKKSLHDVGKHLKRLTCLDIGGSYNLHPTDVLETVHALPELTELHASGLPWQDDTLFQLVESDHTWTGLSIGFSHITAYGLRDALPHVKDTLTHLSLPFMEHAVDNALVGFLGKTLVNLTCLDVRGNSSLSSMAGFFDGRQFNNAEGGELFCLARYSGITAASVEETKRIHPLLASQFTCIIDAGGTGEGIRRTSKEY